MAKTLSLICGVCLFLGFYGCSGNGPGGFIRRNNAGTRSVALPEDAAPETSSAVPAAAGDTLGGGDFFEDAGPQFLGEGDIVEIKEKLFIAQTNDVYLNPEDYMGKTIKYEGIFKTLQYAGIDTPYCFVLRYGPGCCGNDGSAGFEVAWDGAGAEGVYPDEDAWVEAMGVLKTYEEDGYPYLYLALSSLTVKEERGAEFVAH
jgi:hypothetical protein